MYLQEKFFQICFLEFSNIRTDNSAQTLQNQRESLLRGESVLHALDQEVDEIDDHLVRVPILQDSQHHPIDDLDEILDLVVIPSLSQSFADCLFVLILMHQLLQDKLGAQGQHLTSIPGNAFVLESLLEEVEL